MSGGDPPQRNTAGLKACHDVVEPLSALRKDLCMRRPVREVVQRVDITPD
jgi:hypothetical protein